MIFQNIVDIFFHFMLFFVIFIIISEAFLFLLFKKKEDILKKRRITLFGLFLELDNLTILAIAVLMVRYLFILFAIFDKSSIIYVHLFILLLLSFVFGVLARNGKTLVFELVSSCVIYFALICSKLLSGYIVDVRFEWYVLLANFLLILFVIIYITFFLLKNVNDVVSMTKYIRRKRNENN